MLKNIEKVVLCLELQRVAGNTEGKGPLERGMQGVNGERLGGDSHRSSEKHGVLF